MLLFELFRPFEYLRDDLLAKFKDTTLEMKEIYGQHSVDTLYIKKNYKDVLWQLYDDKIIEA